MPQGAGGADGSGASDKVSSPDEIKMDASLVSRKAAMWYFRRNWD